MRMNEDSREIRWIMNAEKDIYLHEYGQNKKCISISGEISKLCVSRYPQLQSNIWKYVY